MSGLAWLILDGFLVVAAVAGVMKAIVSKPPLPLPASRLEAAPAGEKASKETKVVSLLPPAPEEALPAKASLDDLWQKTLFLPTRQEMEPEEKDAQAQEAIAAAMDKNFEFELVGIAQITPVDKPPVPVAVLRGRQSSGGSRASRNTANRRVPGGRQETPQPAATSAALPKPTKLLFREGDPINDTGYLLKAIYPEKKMVEVTRGNQTLQLHINYADAEAVKRREALVEANAKKRQAQEQERQTSIRQKQAEEQEKQKSEQKEREAANPGQPPPPPGENGSPGSGPAQPPDNDAPQDSRAGQIRQQVEQNAQQRQTTPAATPRRSVRPGNTAR